MLKLRPYQEQAVLALWSELLQNPTALLVMGTGTGKTEVLQGFVLKALELKPDFRCCFLVNKTELLSQTQRRFTQNLPYGTVSKFDKTKQQRAVTIATIQSIHKHAGMFHCLIIDEAHNLNESSGQYKKMIDKCLEINPKLKIIAVTATAYRASGPIYGEGKLFTRICFERNLKWAQDNGYLVPVRLKHSPYKFDVSGLNTRMGEYVQEQVNKLTTDEKKMIEQIKDALPQLEDRKKIVWACSCIEHAEKLAEKLKLMGVDTVAIVHSKRVDRDAMLRSFTHGKVMHLVFVSAISEGFDCPAIDAVVFMRPTRSPVLYCQIAGRGLRPYPEKKDCLLLDYGGVVENLGPLHDPVVPKSKEKRGLVEVKMKFCPSCLDYTALSTRVCAGCSHEFTVSRSDELLKNLTSKAYAGSEDGSQDFNLVSMAVKDGHISKNKRECYVVTYHVENLFPRQIQEYIPKGEAWAMAKLNKRLAVMGAKLDELPIILSVNGTITVRKKQQYFEVVNVRAGRTDRDIRLA